MPNQQVILAVDHYLSTLASGVPAAYKSVDPFMEWLETDRRSLQFVQMLMMTLPEPR